MTQLRKRLASSDAENDGDNEDQPRSKTPDLPITVESDTDTDSSHSDDPVVVVPAGKKTGGDLSDVSDADIHDDE